MVKRLKRLKLWENERGVSIPGIVVNEAHNERGGVRDYGERSDLKTKWESPWSREEKLIIINNIRARGGWVGVRGEFDVVKTTEITHNAENIPETQLPLFRCVIILLG